MEELKMKSWKKLSIIGAIVVVLGIGAILVYKEFYDESRGYKNYVSNTNTNSSNDDMQGTTANSSLQTNSPFIELDGKIIALTSDSLTVEVPLQGNKTFKMDANTRVEDFLSPLKEGSLVDIDANGELAYKIETDRTMDAQGTIVTVTDQEVTINYHGSEHVFKKASNFRIEADGYMGPIEGLPADITFNEKVEIVGIDVEDDYDGGYDD